MTGQDDARRRMSDLLREIAAEHGGTVHEYPRRGETVRKVVLRDTRDERGTQYEDATIENDGTVRVVGHDQGPGVSAVFGDSITSYEWMYVITPDRVDDLLAALGGIEGDDVLALLAEYYRGAGGRLKAFLCGPRVGAEFSNWHS